MTDSWAIPTVTFLASFSLQVAIALVILLRPRRTSAVRLAWLIVVFAFPFVGAFAYVLVGEVRLGRRRRQRHEQVLARIGELVTDDEAGSEAELELPPAQRRIAALAETVAGTVARGGNTLRLYGHEDNGIEGLVQDVARARSSCHLLFYIYLADDTGMRVAGALRAAAERGVVCRLLVDSAGSRAFLGSALCRELRDAGVRVAEALPVGLIRGLFRRLDLRNHRKVAVIDGAIGWTGSRNIADPSFAIKPKYAPWIDVMVRLEGPAVYDLQLLFIGDWLLDTDEQIEDLITTHPAPIPDGVVVQVIGTGPNARNTALRQLLRVACQEVRREQIITTPYFAPDDATAAAIYTAPLCAACRRC